MRYFRLGLFLASLLGVTGFLVFSPELAWGQGEGSVLLAHDEELAEAERLNQQAYKLYQEGKYSEAISLAEKALAIHLRWNDSSTLKIYHKNSSFLQS